MINRIENITGGTPAPEPPKLTSEERKTIAAAINELGGSIYEESENTPKIIYNRMAGLKEIAKQKKEALLNYLESASQMLSSTDHNDPEKMFIEILSVQGERRVSNASAALVFLAYVDENVFVDFVGSDDVPAKASTRASLEAARALYKADPKQFEGPLTRVHGRLVDQPLRQVLARRIDKVLNP